MSNENVERMQKGYDAFGKGDLDALRELFSADIVWHSGGNNALSGDYKGLDEVFGLFGKLFEMTEGTFQQEVHDLLASDKHAVAITRATAQRSDGRTLDTNQVAVFHMSPEGKVTEAWLVPADQQATDAFFS